MPEPGIIDNKRLLVEELKLLAILFTGAVMIYKFRSAINNFAFYSFVFFGFLVSRNIVFWTAALFCLVTNPWSYFYYVPYEWYFNLTSTVGVPYISIIGIVVLLKFLYYKRGNKTPDYLLRFYKPVGLYVVFLLIWSLAFGHNIVSVFNILKILPSFLLFLALPRLLTRIQLISFNKIIFFFSLIHFGGSIIEITSPGSFMPLIYFGSPLGIEYGSELIRFVGGITIHLYVLFVALFYLSKKEGVFRSWYLWILISSSYVFILNSATRGWIIASSVGLLLYLFYFQIRFKNSLNILFSIIFIVFLLFLVIPARVKRNITASFKRLEKVEAITSGDLTADGSTNRLTLRVPRVMAQFRQSPVTGFGYSKTAVEHYDGHVGNHSLLLVGGVIGLLIIWFTVLYLVWFFFSVDKKFHGNGFFVFAIFLISVMVIHSTSRDMVSYFMPSDSAFIICFLFCHFNAYFKEIPIFSGNGIKPA